MKFQLLAALFATAAFVSAAPVEDTHIRREAEPGSNGLAFEKRVDKCGEGRPCAGVNRDDNCSTYVLPPFEKPVADHTATVRSRVANLGASAVVSCGSFASATKTVTSRHVAD